MPITTKNVLKRTHLMKRTRNQKKWLTLMVLVLLAACWLPVSAQATARVGVFKGYEIKPGAALQIPVEIRGAKDLYAVDLDLHFDPNVLAFEDADPNTEGLQPALGTFLDAGMVLFNTIDPQTGTVRFVMTQVNPSEPKSGDGILLVLYARALTEGESALEVVTADLSTREGVAIACEKVSASVKVSATAADAVAPTIPVQQPTGLIIIPTLAPTATPTPEPTPIPSTPTPIPATPMAAVATEPPSATQAQTWTEVEEPAENGFSLARSWWILLIPLIFIAGLVGVLIKNRKNGKEA